MARITRNKVFDCGLIAFLSVPLVACEHRDIPTGFNPAFPENIEPEARFFLTHDLLRVVKACPGLARYSADLIDPRVTSDREGTTQIYFSVAISPKHLPTTIATAAGASCHWEVFDDANSMSVESAPCHSICDGLPHKAGEWETIVLPAETPPAN